MYLEKATDLGDRLLAAYNTPSGVPLSNINLKERRGVADMGNNGLASLAEAASLQLEMKYLSEVTGDMVYWKAAEKVNVPYQWPSDEFEIRGVRGKIRN
jgi:mannosyl-oligosaccharide alpha-1,2-mannosidase